MFHKTIVSCSMYIICWFFIVGLLTIKCGYKIKQHAICLSMHSRMFLFNILEYIQIKNQCHSKKPVHVLYIIHSQMSFNNNWARSHDTKHCYCLVFFRKTVIIIAEWNSEQPIHKDQILPTLKSVLSEMKLLLLACFVILCKYSPFHYCVLKKILKTTFICSYII
jgi:hypothetical protein